jgi:hypothetical protein
VATFIQWIVHDGRKYSSSLFYPPLPSNNVTIDEGLIRQIAYNDQSYVP